MQVCAQKQLTLLESIGLAYMDVQLIKQKVAQAGSIDKKKDILRTVKRLAKLTELEQSQQNELEEIAEDQRQLALKAAIEVNATLFAGVELRIGEEVLQIHDDIKQSRFHLVNEEDQLKIMADSA
jgi:uncharacterized protein (DUF342 family)